MCQAFCERRKVCAKIFKKSIIHPTLDVPSYSELMKRRRITESATTGADDLILTIINNYLNFVMQGEGTPALKYWKERGFEEFVSFYSPS
jgi:hypothetical protein